MAEIRVLRWMCGVTKLDRMRNNIISSIGVRANIHLGGGGRPSFARMDSVGGWIRWGGGG